ncbi:MAG TPA: hypothetical protein PLZ84_00270 [Clostridia bacterium]|nr:hypothetical protein [Clostridia bacterium]
MSSKTNDSYELYAGFCTRDITPRFPAALQGQFMVRVTSEVKKPLKVTAVYLETRKDDIRVEHSVWVTVDLSISSEELQNEIGRRAQGFGIDPSHVFVSATHTHDAPFHHRNPIRTTSPEYKGDLGYPEDKVPPDCLTPEEYFEFVVSESVTAIRTAFESRRRAKMGAGASLAKIGHCRYVLLKNLSTGKIEDHMYGYAATREASGNMPAYEFIGFTGPDGDDTVETIGFWDDNDTLMGIVAGIHSPAQISESDCFVSSDIWGFARDYLAGKHKINVPVVTFCMFSGDIKPFDPYVPNNERKIEFERLAGLLADAIADGVQKAFRIRTDKTVLCHKKISVYVPLFPVTEEKYKNALEIIEKNENVYLVFGALGVKERYERMNVRKETEQELLLHAVRLGEVAIGTAPFEMHLPYGLELRKLAQYEHVLPVQLTGGHYGYLPSRKAWEYPSYGIGIVDGITSPEGGDIIVDELAKTLNEMKK